MVTQPGASEIGMRLTLALRDSQGNTKGLLGVLHDEQTIRRRDGSLETFDPQTITHWRVVAKVTAKAGFGAPLSMRIRELEAAATTTWPAEITTEHGKWLLRASKGDTIQRNSVLPTGGRPFGEPGAEIDEARIDVVDFYQSNGLPPAISVPLPAYTLLDEYLELHGWQIAAEFNFMVIDAGDIQSLTQESRFNVKTFSEPMAAWLAVHGGEGSEQIMRSHPATYVSILIDDERVAAGRIAFTDSWGVITCVFVDSNYRRQGIGQMIMSALADTALEQNCGKLTLQVDSSNSPAMSLCQSLGFRLHHRDRCRVSE